VFTTFHWIRASFTQWLHTVTATAMISAMIPVAMCTGNSSIAGVRVNPVIVWIMAWAIKAWMARSVDWFIVRALCWLGGGSGRALIVLWPERIVLCEPGYVHVLA
jgi:hypothetical protein